MKRSRGRSLEAETEAEAMEESCLLAWSSWLVLPATSPGWHCPPVSWALPHQSIIKCLMGFLIGNLAEVFSQLRSLSSDNSDLCQLEKKNQPGVVFHFDINCVLCYTNTVTFSWKQVRSLRRQPGAPTVQSAAWSTNCTVGSLEHSLYS